jgi:hypothetical protein
MGDEGGGLGEDLRAHTVGGSSGTAKRFAVFFAVRETGHGSCRLLGVFLPRRLIARAAESDP